MNQDETPVKVNPTGGYNFDFSPDVDWRTAVPPSGPRDKKPEPTAAEIANAHNPSWIFTYPLPEDHPSLNQRPPPPRPKKVRKEPTITPSPSTRTNPQPQPKPSTTSTRRPGGTQSTAGGIHTNPDSPSPPPSSSSSPAVSSAVSSTRPPRPKGKTAGTTTTNNRGGGGGGATTLPTSSSSSSSSTATASLSLQQEMEMLQRMLEAEELAALRVVMRGEEEQPEGTGTGRNVSTPPTATATTALIEEEEEEEATNTTTVEEEHVPPRVPEAHAVGDGGIDSEGADEERGTRSARRTPTPPPPPAATTTGTPNRPADRSPAGRPSQRDTVGVAGAFSIGDLSSPYHHRPLRRAVAAIAAGERLPARTSNVGSSLPSAGGGGSRSGGGDTEGGGGWELNDFSYEALLELGSMAVPTGLEKEQLQRYKPQKYVKPKRKPKAKPSPSPSITATSTPSSQRKTPTGKPSSATPLQRRTSARTTTKTAPLPEEEDDVECTVCLEELEEGDDVLTLGCSHTFHHRCILQWLGRTNRCPTCRYEIERRRAK